MKSKGTSKKISAQERKLLLDTLRLRFEANPQRHRGVAWSDVEARLMAHADAFGTLAEMEESGGEPDVVGMDATSGAFQFVDCSAETPAGRTSISYDRKGRESRKEHAPASSAEEMASAMGIALLTEAQYHALQLLGEFDKKTSSWLQTPEEIRKLSGALFGDRRYGRTFIYHNGAQSYYAVRGFRGMLWV